MFGLTCDVQFNDNRLPARVWAKIDQTGPCWRWTGCTSGGYATVHWEGRMRYAHRVVYERLVGPIPPGADIDHVRSRGCVHLDCVNPGHLEAVTHSENLRRAHDRRASCVHGHAYTPENTYVKPNGSVACRICSRAAQARFQAKRRQAHSIGLP